MSSDDVDDLARGLDELDADGLAARLVTLERVVRRAEAAIVAVLETADRRGSWKVDGHASVRGWAWATVRWSDLEVRDRVRTVAVCRDAPAVHAELAAGRLGVAQARELGRGHANPRVGHRLVDALPRSSSTPSTCRTRHSSAVSGAGRRSPTSTAPIRATTPPMPTARRTPSSSATASTSMRQLASSWAPASSRSCATSSKRSSTPSGTTCGRADGEGACPAMLERTAPQRRFDALCAVFERAAGTAPGTRQPEPVVNIVVDQATWEAWVARLSGEQPDAPLPDAADVDARRCETVDGVPVDPADAVIAGIVGHVRRVVMDSSGVVIDLGRKRRMYTGSAREAAVLQGRRCWWPGCGQPSSHIDHSTDWARDGHTNPANVAPACPRHNRYKNRGYLTWRDRRGRWHTHRPDGTEIVAA